MERLRKNSLIAFFKITLSLPRKTFNTARNCKQTSPWASAELKFSYNSNSERISFVFTNHGTTPVGTMAKVLTAGNLPNLNNNLSKSLKISAGLCSFFISILEYKCMFKSFSITSAYEVDIFKYS